MKILYVWFFLQSIVFAANILSVDPHQLILQNIQKQNPQELGKAQQVYMKYSSELKKIEEMQKNVFSDKEIKNKIMEKVLRLYKQEPSVFMAELLIYKTIHFENIQNKAVVEKYIKPASQTLYSKKMCNGYLYKGISMQVIEHSNKRALEIYDEGIKQCPYPKFNVVGLQLLSRYNILYYGR